jgi:hypothetical protein
MAWSEKRSVGSVDRSPLLLSEVGSEFRRTPLGFGVDLRASPSTNWYLTGISPSVDFRTAISGCVCVAVNDQLG